MSEQEIPDIRKLYREALHSIGKLLNGSKLSEREVYRLGLFLGTVSRYMSAWEPGEREDEEASH